MMRPGFVALSCAIVMVGSGIAPNVFGAEEPPGRGPNRGGGAQSDQDRVAAEERLNSAWNSMPFEEKMRVMRLHRGLRALPPEERKRINDRIDHFLNMSPQERQRLQQNYQRWQRMSPEERRRAREEFNRRRKEFEEKWRKEHPGEEPPPYLPRRGGPPNRPGPPPAQPPQEGGQPISPAPQAE